MGVGGLVAGHAHASRPPPLAPRGSSEALARGTKRSRALSTPQPPPNTGARLIHAGVSSGDAASGTSHAQSPAQVGHQSHGQQPHVPPAPAAATASSYAPPLYQHARAGPENHSNQNTSHPAHGAGGLNLQQQRVLSAVLAGESIFFTGSAGTGKSFLLRHCINALLDSGRTSKDQVFVTAATGIAAVNIGGTTFHSFSGLGIAGGSLQSLVHKVQSSSAATERWRKARVLVIDEISMLDGGLLDKAEAVARAIRRSSAPFGGLQLLLSGDFFQLPPVGVSKKRSSQAHSAAGADARPSAVKFAFQAECWPLVVSSSFLLTHVYRQKDNVLRHILNKIRVGVCSPDDCRVLACGSAGRGAAQAGVQPTELCALNKHVAQRNRECMAGLKGDKHVFAAHMEGSEYFCKQLAASCTAVEQLTLCAGAQVVLLKNVDPEAGLVNGARGKVYDFVRNRESSWPPMLPRVVFSPPERSATKPTEVPPDSWSMELGAEIKATMTQVPLKLAYALSIHKSQGMTIDSLVVDLRGVFEYGQAYVALSRGVSLDRMQVRNLNPACVRAHPDVVAFYAALAGIQGGEAGAAAGSITKNTAAATKDGTVAADVLRGLDLSDIFGDLD